MNLLVVPVQVGPALGPAELVTGIEMNVMQSMQAVEAKLLYVAPTSAKPRTPLYVPK